MVSMAAGVPSIINTWQAQKKVNKNKIDLAHKNS